MIKPLHQLILFLLLLIGLSPALPVLGRAPAVVRVVDDEYDRYKKRGDDLFKEGRYLEARRQYQNCLEVPGFENDAYAKDQIEECTTGLALRQQATNAVQQGKGPDAVKLFNQLLNLNPDDAVTKNQLTDHYEREGSKLFNQKRYTESLNNYTEALKYATATKRESLLIQINSIRGIIAPPKRIGLKVFTGAVVVGAGVYALLLRTDFQDKLGALNQISQEVDPTDSGIIANDDSYRRYNDAYTAAEAAQRKNGLFKACVGIAAVATLGELYLLLHKPKPRTNALHWKPSSQSVGLAIGYSF